MIRQRRRTETQGFRIAQARRRPSARGGSSWSLSGGPTSTVSWRCGLSGTTATDPTNRLVRELRTRSTSVGDQPAALLGLNPVPAGRGDRAVRDLKPSSADDSAYELTCTSATTPIGSTFRSSSFVEPRSLLDARALSKDCWRSCVLSLCLRLPRRGEF